MREFRLPDLGEGLTEAEIIAWHVKIGDTITVDQIVAEVETAKAAVEIPAPFAGVVTALHGEPGQTLAVGQPLISLADAGQSASPPDGFGEPATVSAQPPADQAETEPGGNVLVGYGIQAASRHGAPGERPASSKANRSDPLPGGPPGRIAVISPLVRKLARDAGLDLAAITGSGPSGLVLRRDVEQAIQQRTPMAAAIRVPPGAGPGSADDVVRRIPLRGTRKATADKLTRSRREIPEATVWVDADATGLLSARAELNSQQPERPVSVISLVARFAILGLRHYPELNARVEADEIMLLSAVHLGFAAQTSQGLVVPVVRDADQLPTRDLAAAITALADAARAGTTSPAQHTGGTFTINNYGVFGVDGSAAIINYPEVAILGLGRITDRPWAVNGQLAIRKVCQLTLAFDHRACDGATAGGFLRFVADCVESPVSTLGEL